MFFWLWTFIPTISLLCFPYQGIPDSTFTRSHVDHFRLTQASYIPQVLVKQDTTPSHGHLQFFYWLYKTIKSESFTLMRKCKLQSLSFPLVWIFPQILAILKSLVFQNNCKLSYYSALCHLYTFKIFLITSPLPQFVFNKKLHILL